MDIKIVGGNFFPVNYGAYDIYLSFIDKISYRPINGENITCPISQKQIDGLYHHCCSCKTNFDSVTLNEMYKKTDKLDPKLLKDTNFEIKAIWGFCPLCHSRWHDYNTYCQVLN